MKNIKKLIALLLVLSLSVASAATSFAAVNFDDDGNRDEEHGLSDDEMDVIIDDARPQHELDNPEDAYYEELEYDEYIKARNEYNEVVKKLTSLDMWESLDEGTFTDKIKAGEFFLSVCRYINNTSFCSEVDSHEMRCQKAYDTLKTLGYVDFDIDPLGEISFINAVRVLVNAFGYKTTVKLQGGGDTQYLSVASSEDIAQRIPDKISETLSRADAAKLLEDSTEADVYIFHDNNNKEKINSLEYFKDVYVITDTVESVSDNAITDGATIKNGIRVGDYLLESTRRDLNEYLACRVDAYYREGDGSGRELLYITYDVKNTIKTVEGYDLESYENNRIYYVENGTRRKLKVEGKAKEVFCGFSPTDLTWEDMENCDYIKLVDNNGDGVYDIVFVYKYDIMLVERVVKSENKIYGLFNSDESGVIEVDFDSTTLNMTDRVGNPVEDYYITENSVLSVAKDPQSTKMRIIVSNMMYQGVVKSVISGEKYHDAEIKFDDVTYTYSTNYDYYKGTRAIKANGNYTVYLDYRRRVAGYKEENTEDTKYGFLIKAWLDTDTGGEDVGVRLLPYDDDMNNFILADKVKIDGDVCSSSNAMFACLNAAAAYQRQILAEIDESFISPDYNNDTMIYLRVPVMYRLNEGGEIKYIDTPYHSERETKSNVSVFEDNSMTMYNDFSKRTSSVKAGGMYLRNTLAFNSDNGNNVALDTKTKVFVVPVSNDVNEINDPLMYTKTNLAYFEDWKYYPQTGDQYTIENRIEAYNVNEARVADVIVYYTSDAVPEIDKKVPLTVVDKVIDAVDEDGDTVRRLIGYQGNAEIQVDLADDLFLVRYYNGPDGAKLISEVKHGDIIRYVTNNDGRMVDYVKVFSLTDEDNPEYVKTGNEYGTVVDPATLNKTMLAVSDGRYSSNGHNTPHVYNALGSYNYGATYRLVYGSLLYKNGTNLVLKTTVDTALGQVETVEIADFSGFNVICIDEKTDKIYVPREDELLAEAGAGEDASKIILHTEGGKQRQLIIIKRAK